MKQKKQNRVTLSLTPAGSGWLVVSLVAFLLATNYSNNVIFMLACLLLGVWLLAAWLTLKNLLGVACKQWRVQPCFAGSDAEFLLLLEATDGSSHFELGCLSQGTREDNQQHLTKLDANGRQWLALVLTTKRRGWFAPQNVMVSSTWPFGLWRASVATPEVPACLVYPKSEGAQSLPSPHEISSDEQSMDDVTGVRVYQEGDSTRRMDWKAMARSEQVLVKTFEGSEQQQTLWLSDDSVEASDFELKLQQLANWVVACELSGAHYGLKVRAEKLAPGSGKQHQLQGLRLLALARREG